MQMNEKISNNIMEAYKEYKNLYFMNEQLTTSLETDDAYEIAEMLANEAISK